MKELIKKQLNDNEGFIIPKNNQFQNEYLEKEEDFLYHITGFTGSAGICLLTKTESILFVDGRYTIQAKKQAKNFTVLGMKEFVSWILNNKIKIVLFEPLLHTVQEIKKIEKHNIILRPKKILFSLQKNKPEIYAPFVYEEKKKWEYQKPFLLTDTESLSWFLGIRSNAPYKPITYAYALILEEKTIVFQDKLYPLNIENVIWKTIDEMPSIIKNYKNLFVDDSSLPYEYLQYLDQPLFIKDPSLMQRACKTKEEQEKIREICQIDGKAINQFLRWIKAQENITEIEAQDHLEAIRKKNPLYKGASFPTISSVNNNGAVIHYRAASETNQKIIANSIYLVDSGGQYFGGTTDVTRTITIGKPTNEQKEMYTRVLKGHIALACAVFPLGTKGFQLDILARQFLWEVGYDYPHGTGHGIGAFLSVHEGPQSISGYPNETILYPGMVLSNEPGFYKEGEFGIRIENMMLVKKSKWNGYLEFEMLTYVVLDNDLIEKSLLTKKEINWIEDYQKQSELNE